MSDSEEEVTERQFKVPNIHRKCDRKTSKVKCDVYLVLNASLKSL